MAKITFPVEAGHIMLFARAIGDTNPVYQDADAAKRTEVGSIIAPPTFPQAVSQFDPDYPLRWRPGQPWFGSGKTASGVVDRPSGGGGLHAEQHFEYHRPLKPGGPTLFRPSLKVQRDGTHYPPPILLLRLLNARGALRLPDSAQFRAVTAARDPAPRRSAPSGRGRSRAPSQIERQIAAITLRADLVLAPTLGKLLYPTP